ncbi:hypothetical protein H0H92_003837 [Tricholoma furcatifolium]|nr:hypothetical protein H0H92_003837 [Tricholoma furcatifolium]
MSSVGSTDAADADYAGWGHPDHNQEVEGIDNEASSNLPSHPPPLPVLPPSLGWRHYSNNDQPQVPISWGNPNRNQEVEDIDNGTSSYLPSHSRPLPPIPPDNGWRHYSNNDQPKVPIIEPKEPRGRHRQRYTYIPSTSSFSPHVDNQQPRPGRYAAATPLPFIPPLVPPPFTGHFPDNRYNKSPEPPIIPPHAWPPAELKPDIPEFPVYASVDPFRGQAIPVITPLIPPPVIDDDEARPPHGASDYDYIIYPHMRRRTMVLALFIDFLNQSFNFFSNTLPRNIYLLFLLGLPSFYFSRVARIFDEADMTMPEIESMALQGMASVPMQELQFTSPAGANLKVTWEAFIDSLLREWKTFNIVSVLLLSAILTLLQIDGAGSDPITRNCSLISLICALMSLLYGCMYTIRFANMRKTYKAVEWAKAQYSPLSLFVCYLINLAPQMAQKSKTLIWWNVWVLLALPATWLAWSIILYVACIMTFVWRTGINGANTPYSISRHAELAIRVVISAVLALGVLYLLLIMDTLRRYGESMDEEFRRELDLVVRAKRRHAHSYVNPYFASYGPAPGEYPKASHSTRRRWFKPIKMLDFRFQSRLSTEMPDFLTDRKLSVSKWKKFVTEAFNAWDGVSLGPFSVADPSGPPRPQDTVAQLLEKWNRKYFQPRSTLCILCHEYLDLFPESPVFAIYLIDVTPVDGQPIITAERFGPIPEGLHRIDIFDQPGDNQRSARRILGRTSIYSTRSPLEGRVRYDRQSADGELNDATDTADTGDTADSGSRPQSDEATVTPNSTRSSRSPSPTDWRPSQSSYIDESGRFRTPVAERRRPRSRSRRYRQESLESSATISHHRGETSRDSPPPASAPPTVTPPQAPWPTSPFDPPNVPVPPVFPPNSEAMFQPNIYDGYYPPMMGWNWGPPPVPPLPPPVIPGDQYGVHARPGHPTPGFGRRRSRTLSPTRNDSRPVGRNIPLPAVSPDYPWSAFARPESQLATPNTYRTVTPSAISNLDHIVPPFMQNQHPGWTPHQYPHQYMTPRTPRHPDPPSNAPPGLMNPYNSWFRSPTPAKWYQHLSKQPKTKVPSPEETPEAPVAGPSTRPQSVPLLDQVGSSKRVTRRRSTSTSYMSFSSNLSQDPIPPIPGDTDSPLHASPVADTVVQLPGEDTEQTGGTLGDSGARGGLLVERLALDPVAPIDRGRQSSGLLLLTDDDHAGPVHAPMQSSATSELPDVVVNGPWTIDQMSLRTIFNSQ